MRLSSIISLLFCAAVTAQSQIQWPLKDDGYNKAVQWYAGLEEEREPNLTFSGTITAISLTDRGSISGLER